MKLQRSYIGATPVTVASRSNPGGTKVAPKLNQSCNNCQMMAVRYNKALTQMPKTFNNDGSKGPLLMHSLERPKAVA